MFGAKNFELLVFKLGLEVIERPTRLNLEKELQSKLIPLGLCYNSGRTETVQPRPEGKFPTSPGVYCIRCKVNDARYYGETGQRKGLSQRLRDWLRYLRANTAKNQKLQADWNFYKEDNFEFLVVHTGPEWDDEKTRKAEEKSLIEKHLANNGVVYNLSEVEKKAPSSNLANKTTILTNQTPAYRAKMSALNKGRPNLEGREAIVAEGNTYLSISEAAEALNYGSNRNPVRNALNKGKYRLATPEEVEQESERRKNGSGPVKVNRTRKNDTGYGQEVIINLPEKGFVNARFTSISEAAAALNVSPQAVSQAIKRGAKGYLKGQEPQSK